ncbi:MAG: stage II sporulation protein E [Syntrophomonadaceae bacterium]|jgi:stage II sporulation protein E|nr:stage II sporulation protein E [Syntrophomonadaceae bacterium]
MPNKRMTRKRRSLTWRQKIDLRFLTGQGEKLAFLFKRDALKYENIFFFIMALVFSRAFILGELLPFSYAFAVAFGHREKSRSFIVFLCSIIGILMFTSGYEMWSNIIALAVLGVIIQWHIMPEDKVIWGMPLFITAVIFVVKALLLLVQGMTLYGIMVIVFEALLSGIITFMCLLVEKSWHERKEPAKFSFEEKASLVVLGMGFIMGLNGAVFWGISAGNIICSWCILLAAFIWGSSGGTMAGVGVGFIPSLSSAVLAESISFYAISGLLAGLFRSFGFTGNIVGFMLGILSFSLFNNNIQTTISGIWEASIASVGFVVFIKTSRLKNIVIPLSKSGGLEIEAANGTDSVFNTGGIALARIQGLAEVFDEMSTVFKTDYYTGSKKYGNSYLDYLYEEITDNFCNQCSRYERCWKNGVNHTAREIMDLFAMMEAQGELKYQDCSVEYKRVCIKGRDMVREINHLYETLKLNKYWADKLKDSHDLVSLQLKGISKVIENLARETIGQPFPKLESERHIRKKLRYLGVNAEEIIPLQNENQIYGVKVLMESCKNKAKCERILAPVLSEYLDSDLAVCEKFCETGENTGHCQVICAEKHNYRLAYGTVQIGKETPCGDSYTIRPLHHRKELIMLSDGMGVGESAYEESQAAVKLLENLLVRGFDKDLALQTINSVLMLRNTRECFATLDMLLIDLYTAEADFIKVGGAPAFIKHKNQVETIAVSSLPIGILESVDIVNEKRQLRPGNMIILVSDGVIYQPHNNTRAAWLPEFILNINEQDPQLTAELIIREALNLCKGYPDDDMTVICARVDLI